jgi:integrase
LVDRISGSSHHTLGAWLEVYAATLDKRRLSENTRRSYKSLLKRTGQDLGAGRPIRSITALDVTTACQAIEAQGKARLAQAFRSFLKDCFREAIVAGWLDENPVRATRLQPVEVKRSRLTLDAFMAIYNSRLTPWLRIAMALAIVSAQRREDICAAQFTDFRDGGWWLTQGKTGTRVMLPLELHLAAVDLSLSDVLTMARKTGAVSRYLVHQTSARGNSPVGAQIWVDTLSRRFSDAVTALGMDWAGKTPPTFHEIRSLSERLYSRQGNVRTQDLLGHRDPRTTATYANVRGAEWVRIQIGG